MKIASHLYALTNCSGFGLEQQVMVTKNELQELKKLEADEEEEIVSPYSFSTYWCQKPILHTISQGKGQVALLSLSANFGLLQFRARCQQETISSAVCQVLYPSFVFVLAAGKIG